MDDNDRAKTAQSAPQAEVRHGLIYENQVKSMVAAGADAAGPRAQVGSTSDERVVNNTMRHAYKVLSDKEKADMQAIKDLGLEFHNRLSALGTSRELSVAKTKIEEAVMWGVKHITA